MSVLQVRGRGLLDAIVIKDVEGVSAYDVCMKLKEAGLLVSAALSCSCESSVSACEGSTQMCKATLSATLLEKHKAHSPLKLLYGSGSLNVESHGLPHLTLGSFWALEVLIYCLCSLCPVFGGESAGRAGQAYTWRHHPVCSTSGHD